jgi:hypothetical protein
MLYFRQNRGSLLIICGILQMKNDFCNITKFNYKLQALKYCIHQLKQQYTVTRIRKRFFKKHGNPFIKLKRIFPAINIAFGFKISKYVIYLMSHEDLYMPLIFFS